MSRLFGDPNNPIWRWGPRKAEDINRAVVGPRVCTVCGRQFVGSETSCPVGHYQGLDKAGPLTGGGCAVALLGLAVAASSIGVAGWRLIA